MRLCIFIHTCVMHSRRAHIRHNTLRHMYVRLCIFIHTFVMHSRRTHIRHNTLQHIYVRLCIFIHTFVMHSRRAHIRHNTLRQIYVRLCIFLWYSCEWCAYRSHAHIPNASFCICTCILDVNIYQMTHCVYSCDANTNDAPSDRMHMY